MNAWIRRAAEAVSTPSSWSIPTWLLHGTAPYLTAMRATCLPVDNTKAKNKLDWTPQYANPRQGLHEVATPSRSRFPPPAQWTPPESPAHSTPSAPSTTRTNKQSIASGSS